MSVSVDPAALDLGYLALFVGYGYAEEVEAKLSELGFGDLRFSHGFVFQHLIAGEKTIGELAALLEVTQQGASKSVLELETMGYLERAQDPEDARVRRVKLSARGDAAVAAGRKIRAALEASIEAKLGAKQIKTARATLAKVLEELGGAEAVRARKVKPPR